LIQKQRRNIKEVSKHLRHANPTITQNIYGHLYPEDLTEMAGAMDELILGVK
jgi:integrase